jgi:hypothetical protein
MSTSRRTGRLLAAAAVALLVPVVPLLLARPAAAASSKFCDGGGYTVLGKTGASKFRGTVPAPAGRFRVQGLFTQFDVDPATFGVFDYTFTGAANRGDMTGGHPVDVFASKVPDHRGLTLTSAISLQLDDKGNASITRTGTGGLSMTLTAKDCSQGGIFQMEPERGDGTRTRITHTLADGSFYYDNPNFRAQLGQFLGADCTDVTTGPPSEFCVQVTPRVNIGTTGSAGMILRDSLQVATRIQQPACGPDFTNTLGLAETRNFCGGMAVYDVASGGRVGMVTGEDATEVANPPEACTTMCQAQDQVKGRLAVLGFPATVPAGSQLAPRTSTDGLDAPLTAP